MEKGMVFPFRNGNGISFGLILPGMGMGMKPIFDDWNGNGNAFRNWSEWTHVCLIVIGPKYLVLANGVLF